MTSIFQAIIRGLLDFIYPPACVLCDRRMENAGFFCPDCHGGLLGSMDPSAQSGREDFHHLKGEIFFDRVFVGWAYSSEIEELVHRVKYQRGVKLARTLGRMVGEALAPVFRGWEEVILIPVPLHKTRLRERGYNQSDLLCRGVMDVIPAEIRTDVLVRSKYTATQTKLNAEEREKNVGDAFAVRRFRGLEGRRVIVVDDVSTTGATLNSCARCLRAAGVQSATGLALARPTLM